MIKHTRVEGAVWFALVAIIIASILGCIFLT